MHSFRLLTCRFSFFQPLFLATALVFAFATPQAKALGPHGDLFAGYSHLSSKYEGDNGFQFDGHLKVAPFLGAEGSVSIYPDVAGGGTGYLYLFGPRATVSIKKVHLFAHFLLGGEHSDTYSSFVYGGGGGLDYSFQRHLAWRFQGDALHEPNNPGVTGSFATGPVLRF